MEGIFDGRVLRGPGARNHDRRLGHGGRHGAAPVQANRAAAMSGARRVPVLFLDLDDTVRWGRDTLGRWVNTPDDVRIFPEGPDLLRRYRAAGWRIAAVSNQGGVALGHVTEAAVMETARETQRQCGGGFDAIAMCAHHPAPADPPAAVCLVREPESGLT